MFYEEFLILTENHNFVNFTLFFSALMLNNFVLYYKDIFLTYSLQNITSDFHLVLTHSVTDLRVVSCFSYTFVHMTIKLVIVYKPFDFGWNNTRNSY